MPRKVKTGLALIYGLIAMTVLTGFVSLAVDLGRVQVAKTQVRQAADAAAIYGAYGLASGTLTARSNAITAGAENTVDTGTLSITNSDISFGTWSSASKTFTVSSTSINAIKVSAHRSGTSGVPLLFGGIIGQSRCNVTATSIAVYSPPISVNQNIPATGDPFLAGMAAGSTASAVNPNNSADVAGTTSNMKQSPVQATMTVTNGQIITFDSISGNAANGPGITDSGGDGDTSNVGHNNLTTNSANNTSATFYNDNGIADARMPINCTWGLFLDDNAPNTTAAPSTNLDFSTAASRDFSTLSPQLKQIFFVGDGLDSSGNTQQFVAPAGATRLYLGTWDFYQWNNNSGSRTVNLNRAGTASLVK